MTNEEWEKLTPEERQKDIDERIANMSEEEKRERANRFSWTMKDYEQGVVFTSDDPEVQKRSEAAGKRMAERHGRESTWDPKENTGRNLPPHRRKPQKD